MRPAGPEYGRWTPADLVPFLSVESWTSFDRQCQGEWHSARFEGRSGLVRAVKPCAFGAPATRPRGWTARPARAQGYHAESQRRVDTPATPDSTRSDTVRLVKSQLSHLSETT